MATDFESQAGSTRTPKPGFQRGISALFPFRFGPCVGKKFGQRWAGSPVSSRLALAAWRKFWFCTVGRKHSGECCRDSGMRVGTFLFRRMACSTSRNDRSTSLMFVFITNAKSKEVQGEIQEPERSYLGKACNELHTQTKGLQWRTAFYCVVTNFCQPFPEFCFPSPG